MFSGSGQNWVLDLNKEDSKQALFFKVLKLKPLEENEQGGGRVNKAFKSYYQHVPEVALHSERDKVNKLHSTYVKGFFKKLSRELDLKFDWHLRPHFTYLTVVTGRASARKPSLHQVPSRTDDSQPRVAKMVGNVKRQMITKEGHLYIKADYSAHEVRNWAISSGDKVMARAFRVGLEIWRKFRTLKKMNAEIRKQWEDRFKEADLHRVNYSFFFNIPAASVNKSQRQSVKQVIFGVLYGKGAPSLAQDLSADDTIKLQRLNLEEIRIQGELDQIQKSKKHSNGKE
jgi:DNA polymerase-1